MEQLKCIELGWLLNRTCGLQGPRCIFCVYRALGDVARGSLDNMFRSIYDADD